MSIQNWSENIMLVDLPAEPQILDEMRTVIEIARQRDDCDIVMDFTSVDIVTSSSLSSMLKLRKLLNDCGKRLVLCNMAAATRKVFKTTGIEEIFDFADDKFTALSGLQMVN